MLEFYWLDKTRLELCQCICFHKQVKDRRFVDVRTLNITYRCQTSCRWTLSLYIHFRAIFDAEIAHLQQFLCSICKTKRNENFFLLLLTNIHTHKINLWKLFYIYIFPFFLELALVDFWEFLGCPRCKAHRIQRVSLNGWTPRGLNVNNETKWKAED